MELAELSDDERWDVQRGELMRDSDKAAKPDRKAPRPSTDFACTDPAGRVWTFSSSTRAPTHVVAILPALDDPLRKLEGYGEAWQIMGWCDEAGAQRLHECLATHNRYPKIVILDARSSP